MAAATTTALSFFTTPTTSRRTNFKHLPYFSSKTNPTFCNPITSISSNTLTFSSSPKSTFSSIPKFSESEPAVIDVEPTSELTQIAETTEEETPKPEQIFAVVMIGSRQYIIFPGRFLTTQRLKGANVGDKIVLNKVLLVGTKTTTYIGQPIVTNAAVHAVVEDVGLNPKVVVYKYKKRKNYRRNIGHRQPNTRIRITGITGYQDFPAVTLDSLKQSV
ncbi:50S ribosomal protein L21 protein [Thalictrum thalictroides]|uniref:50S ribosomal protein L21 protein n=1 Tax=Thalictrum thalictroides TaxID=46969 RepID=A0A7J6WY22_THATH|nr:50S ribosomal protein L21 protein [Thalictrum thalictroides]